MIPVELQPEPADFDENVRRRGRSWLAARGVEPDTPPPDPAALPTYWRRANKQLWKAYDGVCAYLAIHCGTNFQLRNTGDGDLRCVIVTLPPWPGVGEARRVRDHWAVVAAAVGRLRSSRQQGRCPVVHSSLEPSCFLVQPGVG